MATTVIRYVDTASAGGDGTTTALSGAQAAYAGIRAGLTAEFAATPDLTSSDIVLKFICAGGQDNSTSSTYTVPTFVCDATRYLWITVDSGSIHSGKYDTGKYRITCSGGTATQIFTTACTHIVCEDLQIVHLGSTVIAGVGLWHFSASNYRAKFYRCVFHTSHTGTPTSGSSFLQASVYDQTSTWHIVNCVFTGRADHAIFLYRRLAGNNGHWCIYNNTMVGQQNGFYGPAENGGSASCIRLYNNIVERYSGSAATAYYVAFEISVSDCNISDDTSSPNNTFDSLTCSFVDKAGFDLHLDAADTAAAGMGTNLSADSTYPFSVDIDGNTRTRWSIGADDGPASGALFAPNDEGLMLLGPQSASVLSVWGS